MGKRISVSNFEIFCNPLIFAKKSDSGRFISVIGSMSDSHIDKNNADVLTAQTIRALSITDVPSDINSIQCNRYLRYPMALEEKKYRMIIEHVLYGPCALL